MFTLYETAPKYCSITDGLLGYSLLFKSQHETLDAARAAIQVILAASDAADRDPEIGFEVRDARGVQQAWWSDPTPAIVPAAIDEEHIPF